MAYFRALSVIAVVLAHTDLGSLYSVQFMGDFIHFFSPWSFMIPVFFFVVGYFFDSGVKVGGYVKKRFRRLVVPYYWWNLVYAIIFFVVTSMGLMQMAGGVVDLNTFFQPWIEGKQFVFNLAMWFVLTLF
jgi:fucose 4-O-acetylase-like acetyltransferase